MNQEPTLTMNACGTKEWHLHGKLHRDDAPAIEWADGSKAWCLCGKLHRDGAPAIERANGTKEWCLHGELHRVNGPAIERADGSKEWYKHGMYYATAEAWAEALLQERNEPHDDASIDAFLKQILKKSIAL